MNRILILTACLLLTFSCQSPTPKETSTSATTSKVIYPQPDPPGREETKNLIDEVHQLKDAEAKKKYLLNVEFNDQKVRTDATKALQEHGYESAEDLAATKKIWDTDSRNLIRIEAYLEKFGYPKKKEVGKDAASTPWLVIHHANGLEPRIRNFPVLYEGYKNGDLDGGQFAFYLNRFYDMEFGSRLVMENPFREEDEIATLIKALKLPR